MLPVFALANAGVTWSSEVLTGRGRRMLATIAALVVGKLLGILVGARAAVYLGIANKPSAYGWCQVMRRPPRSTLLPYATRFRPTSSFRNCWRAHPAASRRG